MMETDDPRDTAHPLIPTSLDELDRGRLSGVDWRWVAVSPLFLLAVLCLAWGFVLLAPTPAPAFLPALPAPLSGIDVVASGLFLGLFPVGALAVLEDRRRRGVDEQFPDLLSDMAANRRAGFTLAESVELAARGDYGPLTPDVRSMAAQISWNVPFEEALRRFADRVDTPLVLRSTTLVLEAERSGGQITDVLSAVARDAREIRHLERERRLSMQTYTMVMYVTFLVFLGVVAVLHAQLLPELLKAAASAGGEDLFASSSVRLDAYRTFFFTAAIVQALGSGSMAGFMARGRLGPGLIHAATMVLMALVTFSLILA